MTMAFFATEDQLAGLSVGDCVLFSFWLEGGEAEIVSIKSETTVQGYCSWIS